MRIRSRDWKRTSRRPRSRTKLLAAMNERLRRRALVWFALALLLQPVWAKGTVWAQGPVWPPGPQSLPPMSGNSAQSGGGNPWDSPVAAGGHTPEAGATRSLGNAAWLAEQAASRGGTGEAAQPHPHASPYSPSARGTDSTGGETVRLSEDVTRGAGDGAEKAPAASLDQQLRLPPSTANQGTKGRSAAVNFGPITTTISALAIVLGIFLVFAWLMRRGVGKGMAGIPSEMVEVLGQIPLNGRQRLCVIRFGRKLVLACVSVDGAETLAELTEATEVEELLAVWQRSSPTSASHAFRKVFAQYTGEAARQKQAG